MKYQLLIIIFFLFSYAISDENKWSTLQDSPVLIKVLKEDYPKCSTQIMIDNSVENILEVIEDVSNYKIFFDSIIISDINDNDQVRLAIDMPFPFSNRDYTVKFNRNENETEVNYLYESIISKDFNEDENYVRLTDAKGGWTISKIYNDKGILVTYTWNGDMKGDFPSWAYTKAWVKQGNEIMLNLKTEVNRRNNNEN